MRLLDWNILYSADYEAEGELIKSTMADIITLQEVGQNFRRPVDVLGYFKKLLPDYHVAYAPMGERLDENGWIGNAIFSRYPIVAEEAHFLSDAPDRWHHRRNVLIARLDVQGREFVVATTHLATARPDHTPTDEKIAEAKKLSALLPQRSPMIVTGDFNGTLQSPAVQAMLGRFATADPDATKTFPCFPLDYDGLPLKDLTYCFDYIFSTPDLVVKSFTTPPATTSDHLPLLVEFT